MILLVCWILLLQSSFATAPNPNWVRPVPNQYSFLRKYFDKYLSIFGVNIFATKKVPSWMVKHAGNVMAQYLDYDATGMISNPDVIKEMISVNATLVMFYNSGSIGADLAMRQLQKHNMQGQDLDYEDIPSWVPHMKDHKIRFLNASNVNPCYHVHKNSENCPPPTSNKTHTLMYGRLGADDFDASLEEILHLISDTGYGPAYPKQFLSEPGSVLMHTMDEMIADCGWAFNHTRTYPNCRGKYHYNDPTCDYSCLGTEYFMWSLTTLLGGQDGSHSDATSSRCGDIMHEWEMCSPSLLKKLDPDVVKLYALETGNTWKIPNVLPDGTYKPKP